MVIFGITGDLSKRLLLPAIYNLARQRALSNRFAIIGFAGSEIPEQAFRDSVVADLENVAGALADTDTVEWLAGRVRYVGSDFENESGWKRLSDVLGEVETEHGTGKNCLFYLATAPEFFLTLTRQLAHHGLMNESDGYWRRIIIEKPFGHDLESARALNRDLLSLVRDDQIYRIDHYLGKETVQNIMVFRFANGIFEPIWNRRYIDHVQITVAESLGVEMRGRYYDRTGALRDMVPNHIAQLIALTGMEPPGSFSSHALQNEQVKMLEALQPIHPEDCPMCVVRGQYEGYRGEPYVNPLSDTETFVALKFTVDNWRWAGVPFYVRTGKMLAARDSKIVIRFRSAPLALFRSSGASLPQPNSLVLGIQPAETIQIEFEAKVPGPHIETATADLVFDYRGTFGERRQTGYETLLYDAIIGDSSLFKRADMIEAGWSVIQPILDAWSQGRGGPLYQYAPGSDGPEAAHLLIGRDGREWRPFGASH